MHKVFTKFVIPSAAVLAVSTSVQAQETVPSQAPVDDSGPLQISPDNWILAQDQTQAAYYHKQSGAICDTAFRDLKLTLIKDYASDGSNIGCHYEKAGAEGLSRFSYYVYTADGLTGPIAYQEAKAAIVQFNQTSAVTVTERKEEGQACHRGVIQPLAEAILGRMKEEGAEGRDAQLGLGLAMYEYAIPKENGQPATSQTSMLSVYQTGKWVVKTRVTLPKSESSYRDACNYGGLASVALARSITRQDAPAVEGLDEL